MSKPKMCVCKMCKADILKDNAYVIKGEEGKRDTFYCNIECFDKLIMEKQLKKVKNVDPHIRELNDYIYELYDKNVNFPFISSQIKSMKDNYDFKTLGILLTLKYYVEVLEIPFNQEYGITNVITKYYKLAKDDYINKLKIEKLIDEFDFVENVQVVTRMVIERKDEYYEF